MKKIKDRMMLSILAGGVGTVNMLIIDRISRKFGKSKRSYPTTAAGVWVNSRKQAESPQGQFLGISMIMWMSMLGAFGLINFLSKYGKDHMIPKGIVFGGTFGSMINALLSVLVNNKMKSKDATSNLSYLLTNCMFGLTTALIATKLGHESLFDAAPANNRLKPTEKTSEEQQLALPRTEHTTQTRQTKPTKQTKQAEQAKQAEVEQAKEGPHYIH